MTGITLLSVFVLGCDEDECFHLKLNAPHEVTLERYVGRTQNIPTTCGDGFDLTSGDTFWLRVGSEETFLDASCSSPDDVQLERLPASVAGLSGPGWGRSGGGPGVEGESYYVLGTSYELSDLIEWEFHLYSVDPPSEARLLADYDPDAPHLYATRWVDDCGDVWEAQLKLVEEQQEQ